VYAERVENGVELQEPANLRAAQRTGAEHAEERKVSLDMNQPSERLQNAMAAAFERAGVRTTEEVRSATRDVAEAVVNDLKSQGTNPKEAAVVVNAPAGLTSALETELEKRGVATLHATENGPVRGSNIASAEEIRGLNQLRSALPDNGRGMSDQALRDQVASAALREIGSLPRAEREQAAQEVAQKLNLGLARGEAASIGAGASEKQAPAAPVAAAEGPSTPAATPAPAAPELAEQATEALRQTAAQAAPAAPQAPVAAAEAAAPVRPSAELGEPLLGEPSQVQLGSTPAGRGTPEKLQARGSMAVDSITADYGEKTNEKLLSDVSLQTFGRNGIDRREVQVVLEVLKDKFEQKGLGEPGAMNALVGLANAVETEAVKDRTMLKSEGVGVVRVSELREALTEFHKTQFKAETALESVGLNSAAASKTANALSVDAVRMVAREGVDKVNAQAFRNELSNLQTDGSKASLADALNVMAAARDGKDLAVPLSTGQTLSPEQVREVGQAVHNMLHASREAPAQATGPEVAADAKSAAAPAAPATPSAEPASQAAQAPQEIAFVSREQPDPKVQQELAILGQALQERAELAGVPGPDKQDVQALHAHLQNERVSDETQVTMDGRNLMSMEEARQIVREASLENTNSLEDRAGNKSESLSAPDMDAHDRADSRTSQSTERSEEQRAHQEDASREQSQDRGRDEGPDRERSFEMER
jgi:hypothetical protein